jgi:hypothetical protein
MPAISMTSRAELLSDIRVRDKPATDVTGSPVRETIGEPGREIGEPGRESRDHRTFGEPPRNTRLADEKFTS